MRKSVLSIGLLLAVVVLLPGSVSAAAGGTDRPLKGSASGSATVNLLTGESHAAGVGISTHLGLTSAVQYGGVVPTGGGTFGYSGTWTGTAADGDTLVATSTGTISFSDATHATALFEYVVIGGTGRFADATGSFTGTAQFTRVSLDGAIATDLWDVSITGRLSF